MTPQETDPDLPGSGQESLAEVWVAVACCNVRGTECGSVWIGPFEDGCHFFITSHIVWSQVKQNREGTQPCPPIENWIKDLWSMALPIKTRPSFPQSVSPIRKLP